MVHAAGVALALLVLLASPSPSLAVRGIGAPHEMRPPKTCAEMLRTGRHLRVTFSDGRELVGKVAYADAEGLGLRPRGSDEVTRIEKEQVASLRVRNRRFPRISSVAGFAVGVLGGVIYGAAYNARHPDDDWGFLATLAGIVIGGGAGLFVGTAIPIIHPGEKEIET